MLFFSWSYHNWASEGEGTLYSCQSRFPIYYLLPESECDMARYFTSHRRVKCLSISECNIDILTVVDILHCITENKSLTKIIKGMWGYSNLRSRLKSPELYRWARRERYGFFVSKHTLFRPCILLLIDLHIHDNNCSINVSYNTGQV